MIYVCLPAHNEAPTIGLVLWKIRKVFGESPREYQLLVADDGSDDGTREVLEPYVNVLPLTIIRHDRALGYPASVEALATAALERSDRPRRDALVLMQADFSHGPEHLPDLLRRFDSGADLVVGEGSLAGEPSRARRFFRRWAPALVRRAVRVPPVRDPLSGFLAVRLSCLQLALRDRAGAPLLTTDSLAANAELVARLGARARRVETVPVIERADRRQRGSRTVPGQSLRTLWRARPLLRAARLAGETTVTAAGSAGRTG